MKIEGDISVRTLIRRIRNGIRILSHVNWVSACGFHIPVASLLGIAGFIYAIKDGRLRKFDRFPRSLDIDSSSWIVPGLQNLGNNCFLNVILQALASCSSFQSFLEEIVEEFESLSHEEWVERLPLTAALASLVEELCTVRQGREVLCPRQVMLAMHRYIPHFNLTSQQDAEEAFYHILSSLREELSQCYVPNHSLLADVAAIPSCRILTPKSNMDQSEQGRWQQIFLGPFDGILGSILTCQSCSFQISLDFQFFYSLHLSPVLSGGATIAAGSSVEDWLRQFFVAEQLENYHCSRCWHIAAIKYLSSINEYETDTEKLRHCSMQDSCDCKTISHLGALPWSNRFSRTFKQLSMARSPKILCIHLQRASVNVFGELVKFQGHILFPLILNLSPFMNSGAGINWEQNLSSGRLKQQHQRSFFYSNHLNMQLDTRMLNGVSGQNGKSIYSDSVVAEECGQTGAEFSGNTYIQAFQGESSLPNSEGCSGTTSYPMPAWSDDKESRSCPLVPSNRYRLVSVVQHFGRAGSGHYQVYRRVKTTKLNDGDSVGGLSESASVHWFCISDSEVYSVSEKQVLDAEASVLFYEKILEN